MGVESEGFFFLLTFYHRYNNQRKCLGFRMFFRNSGLGELRNVVCRKLIHTYLSHLLFYQCSLCSEHELVIVIFSSGGNFLGGMFGTGTRLEMGREKSWSRSRRNIGS